MKITRRTTLKALTAALLPSGLRILSAEQPTVIPWEYFCLPGLRDHRTGVPDMRIESLSIRRVAAVPRFDKLRGSTSDP